MILAGLSLAAFGQEKPQNQANWKMANRFTSESLRPFLYSSSITPGWINRTDRFWYSWRDSSGTKHWLVDPRAKTKEPLFDAAEMAALISEAVNRPVDSTTLNVTGIVFDEKDEDIIRFASEGFRFEYNRKTKAIKSLGRGGGAPTPGAGGPGGGGGGGGRFGGGGGGGQGAAAQARDGFRNFSPDRKAYVYAQDHNLFYVEVKDGKDQPPIQLSSDGERFFSFGSRADQEEAIRQQRILNWGNMQQNQQQTQQQDDNDDQMGGGRQGGLGGMAQGSEQRVRANVTWSRDSKRFFVTRSDSRKVSDLWLVNSLVEPRPGLLTYKYAMPGEENVTQQELFAFDPDRKRLKKLPVEKWKDQRMFDLHWQDGTSDKMRLVRRDRLQRNLELLEIDLRDSSIQTLLTEKVENAFLESQNVRYVKPGGDFIWFSERTGWGHYYLYSNDGKLKNAITSGPWRAAGIAQVDEEKGQVWVLGQGREKDVNPYYTFTYRVGMDGKGLQVLNPGNADNTASLSPSRNFVVNVASRIDMPSVVTVRDRSGDVVMTLEEMDISRLKMAGWMMPEAFVVKAADGVTDIYGNLWKPADFNPKKKYPIIANVYPGPQTESVSSTFSATTTNQRLAALGFIVIQIGNRGGNPARSNAYHSYGYYNLRDYGLADKKAGIEELALRHGFIDVERVGIFGHSGGGFMTAAALLVPPFNDFFKVGVSSAGNHDNNVYNQNWSEQHHGLREVAATQTPPATPPTGRTQTPDPEWFGADEAWLIGDPQAAGQGAQGAQTGQTGQAGQTRFQIRVPTNHEVAANLKGHLLLVHGDMDNNVHPAGTIKLVNALIRNNKRFDFMLMPGQLHGFGPMQGYFTQMLMEYFAEHLMGDYYRGTPDMNDKTGGN